MKRRFTLLGLTLVAAGCGGGTPTSPGTNQTATNAPPVISAFTVQGTRSREPANFADLSESVPVTVQVTDAESNASDFQYTWSATLGTFSGSGRSVTWKAPATADTPLVVTLSLEVVETYASQGKSLVNRAARSVTLSLHNSIKEVGDLSRQFLLDFSDSNLPTPMVMRHFQPGCYGTEAETSDVDANRRDFRITNWTVDLPVTSVNFGGACPIPGRNTVQGDACSRVHTDWRSTALRDLGNLPKGQSAETHGVDYISAFYYEDQQRWRLCDSQYIGDSPSFLKLPRSLVP